MPTFLCDGSRCRLARSPIYLLWDGGKPQDYYTPEVIVEISEGVRPYPYKISDGAYSLSLLLNAKCTVRAEAYCQMGTAGKAESHTATVDGGDQWFPK